MERDKVFPDYILVTSISTHTLTWSVTVFWLNQKQCRIISTHTLTWSVTGFVDGIKSELEISTHTLTWSVTLSQE